jgi:hypothetical protein
MVCVRDYARLALSTRHTCCEAFRVGRQRCAGRERLELSEPRHARAAQPIERELPLHVVAHQLAHTHGDALVQRLDGPSERGLRDQIRPAFGSWGADEEQAPRDVPANGGVS